MPFIGQQPKIGAYKLLDSITTSATATYALTASSTAYFPELAQNLIVSLNGVTQAPISAYTVSGSNIVFASALTSSDVIDYILALGDVLNVGSPGINTVGITELNVSDGTSGQALTTNGSGTLSFATISTATPTLAAVTGAGATTSNAVTIGNLTSTGIDDNATSNAITIDSNENVGIGLSSPTAKLHVKGDDGLKFVIDSIYAANETLSFTSDNNTGYLLNNSTGTTSGAEGIGFNSANSKMEFKADGGTRMTIRGTGNVGIGTSSPAYRLDVYDTSNPAQIRLRNFQNTNGLIFKSYSGNEAWLVNADNGPMVFKTNNSERMRISSTGNVGIGTSSPQQQLHVSGAIRFSASGTDANRWNVYWNGGTGDLIVVSSDARLKKDFDYGIAGIETVNKLKPVRFTWKENNKRQLGFTAQESLEADEHLAWNDTEKDQWGLDGWEGYAAVLTKAIQEQQAMIQALETRIATLENN